MVKILVTNDDGIHSPGLKILAETLSAIGEVVVVAPDRNRSGASNSLSLDRPLRVQSLGNNMHSVNGTPTDCVHLALTGLLEVKPDMVVSGVNAGSNLGDDVLYSGTVAAATEGRFLGLPAMAISLVGKDFNYFSSGALVAKALVSKALQNALPKDTILSVNVPDLPMEQINGIEITRLGTRHCAEPTIKQVDPRGNTIYWIGPPGLEEDAGIGTDFFAIKQNKISVTSLHVDFTNYKTFEQLSGWVDDLDLK